MPDIDPETAGYHLRAIPRGVFGKLSKIREEVEEVADAEAQQVAIMVLVELSDLYGAIEGYLAEHFPDMGMSDLAAMSAVTQRAFRNGQRTPRQ